MAPELVAGGAPTECSDVYSLGALLYLVRCGRYPLPLGSDDAKNSAILAAHRISQAPRGVRLAGGVGDVIWNSFQPRIEERFSSIELFLEALSRAADGDESTFFTRLQSRFLGV
jgi:serine/threonine protein kinase